MANCTGKENSGHFPQWDVPQETTRPLLAGINANEVAEAISADAA